MVYGSTDSTLNTCHIESKQKKKTEKEKFVQNLDSWASWRIIRVGNKNTDTNLTNTHWIKWQCHELTSNPPPWLSNTSRGGRTNIWQIEITFPIRRNANYKENIYTAHIVTCSRAIRREANGKQTSVTSSQLHTSQCSLRIANFTIKGYQKGFSNNRANEISAQIPQGGLLSWMLRQLAGNMHLGYFLNLRVFLKVTFF